MNLMFMDCHMPELDGYEATRRIRARTDHKRDITIVGQTASALVEDIDLALSCGMDDVLGKPFDLDDLRATLARWLPAGDAHGDNSRAP